VYREDPGFEAPERDAKVWRYSDLPKFIRVLQSHTLFFAGASLLTDNYEGSLTRPSLPQYVRTLTEKAGLSEQQAYQSATLAASMIGVNSWHLSQHESAAMWQLYSHNSDGIVIQSTFDRLSRSFHRCDKNIWIGRVRYIDYTQAQIGNVNDIKQWFLHKRREFAHEQELRAMMILDPEEPGREVPCDLTLLLQAVLIAPTQRRYMLELVSEVCKRFDVDVEVRQSALDDPPPLLIPPHA
jgi:hypothetical protein